MRKAGFSFLELLIIVAILCIFIAILAPALGRLRDIEPSTKADQAFTTGEVVCLGKPVCDAGPAVVPGRQT